MRRAWRLLVLGLCAGLGVALATAMLALPEPAVNLRLDVQAAMARSGVAYEVTAVLLNFRGWDTLLEIVVLLLALLGMLAGAGQDHLVGVRLSGSPQPVLQLVTRLLAPLMALVAVYLLWAGAHQPGGAFQAGAVLASAAVLLYLAGLIPAWPAPRLLLRLGLVAGFLVFWAVAVLGLGQGALLQYPPGLAGALIVLIESALMLSLGLILAGLFLWLPDETEEAEE